MRLVSVLFLMVQLAAFQGAFADTCNGATTDCWDPCTSAYQVVAGNSCSTQWDSNRGCYEAIGSCTPGPSDGCSGQSTNCWDPCSGSYMTMQDANACTTAWSPANGCYQALGYCQ